MRGLNITPSILLVPFFCLLPLVSPISATPHQPSPPIPIPPSPAIAAATATIPFTFRNATLDDADDITTVSLDAFRRAPLWKYIYQFADDVDPLYTWTCQREVYLRLLQQDTVTVIAVPDPTAAGRERVVSVAVWDFNQTRRQRSHHHHANEQGEREGGYVAYVLSPELPLLPMGVPPNSSSSSSSSSSSAYSSSPTFNCSAHLDLNMTRAMHYSQYMEGALQRYLREPIGRQLYLAVLATHPDWDGNGFAATHLRWGKAQLGWLEDGGEGVPLTLVSTPAGYPLYVSEGFQGLKNVTVERLDGEGVVWHEAMKFEEGGDGVDEL